MRTVVLQGSLAEQFGERFTLNIVTPAQAVHALTKLLPGFQQAMRSHPIGFHVFVAGRDIAAEELRDACSKNEEIVISPVIAGSGAAGRVIAGVVILAVSAYYGFQPGMALGVGLIAGGAAQLLAPKPKTSEMRDNPAGYTFSGGVNSTGQGRGIALAYGIGLSDTDVISAQIVSEDGVFYASRNTAALIDVGDVNFSGPAEMGTTTGVASGAATGTWNDSGTWSSESPVGHLWEGEWSYDDLSSDDDKYIPGSDGGADEIGGDETDEDQ
ncbi:MAG: hypothetical protein QM803_08890 [Rhodocyclaceae bacterium]